MAKQIQTDKKGGVLYYVFSIIISIFLIGVTAILCYQIYHLNVLPTNLLVPIILLLSVLDLLVLFLLNFYVKHFITRLLMCIMCVTLCFTFSVGNVYLMKTFDTLETVTNNNSGKVKNTISMYTKASASYGELKDLEGEKVGVLNNLDSTSTKKVKKDIKKQSVSVEYQKYDNVQAEVEALYNGDVEAIILNKAYVDTVVEMDAYTTFNDDVKEVYTYTYYSKEENEPLVVSDITSNPFTILISGNDSYGALEDVSRSDVNLLVTVNPKTSTVLMTSLPRDYYVETICSDGACSYGAMDKLTHTGLYGIDCLKETIQNLLDIEINYTFRVNFSSMIDLVNTLGGIDVYIEEGLEVDTFFTDGSEGVTAGWNHLDGARALAFCRERKSYLDGDVQRARNQQQALQAIIDKAISSDALLNYSNLLNVMSGAFETNMSMDEITSLVKYELQATPDWQFQNYVINGYGDEQPCASMGDMTLSVMDQDAYSVEVAHKKIDAVLNDESADDIVDEEEIEPEGSNPDYSYAEAFFEEWGFWPEGYDAYGNKIDDTSGETGVDQTTYYDEATYYDQTTYYDPNAYSEQ